MSTEKRNRTATYAALCAFALLHSLPVEAQEPRQAAPLHIKISPQESKKTPSKPQILKAKTGKTLQSTQKVTETAPKQQKTQIKSTDCNTQKINLSPKSKNKHKSLADSLKTYIKDQKRDPAIISDIYAASKKTETSFELLLIKAMIESDLGRVTTSKTSTARGTFQFIEPTWLILMKRYGHRIGYSDYADAIEINRQTRLPQIKGESKITRSDILSLRENTKIAALIKSYQIKDESKVLQNFKNGGRINATDHYIAHMLGLSQAREFYKLRENESPIILSDSKNSLLKQAVKLNPYFFHDKNGNGLTASGAYKQFHRKISETFARLRDIDQKYGQGNSVNANCQTPNIQNARTPNSAKKEKRPDISSILALAQNYKGTTQKIKMTAE